MYGMQSLLFVTEQGDLSMLKISWSEQEKLGQANHNTMRHPYMLLKMDGCLSRQI